MHLLSPVFLRPVLGKPRWPTFSLPARQSMFCQELGGIKNVDSLDVPKDWFEKYWFRLQKFVIIILGKNPGKGVAGSLHSAASPSS